ncbi:MAG: Crp/Fnr family transcriptional regulator [Paenirhodobacter sp.]|uniref:Crp/Fnr family transcriptional regulator n=1 Tax=Paenirhodobacter sp. TaxID=1965326 RepID=UPI003D14CB6F
MADWISETPAFAALDAESRAALSTLEVVDLPRGAVLFRPGDAVAGFVVVLSGRIEVYLSGANGRELMLYAVEPGQSCVQTTLGLLGTADYAGEAITARPTRLVMIPRALFLRLMDLSPGFRALVFAAFAERMDGMIRLMERVSFQSVECRLAAWLCAQAEHGRVQATHQEIASRIGSAREVVSRRLDAFARRGWVRTERGAVVICDPAALKKLALAEG